jgi:zinc protease
VSYQPGQYRGTHDLTADDGLGESNADRSQASLPATNNERRADEAMKSGRNTVFLTLLSVLSLASVANASIPELRIEKYVLANGLEVILHEDHRVPLVTVSVRYRVLATPQPPDLTGLGHVIEHVLPSSPRAHVPDLDRDTLVSTAGGSGDAATSFDGAYYWSTVPSPYLAQVLWLQSEMMAFAQPSEKNFQVERSVVFNEHRQRVENARYGIADHAVWEALFPAPHPYRHTVIGLMSDIERSTLEDVLFVYQKYYHPGNAAIVIDGDFTPEQARELVSRYFGTLPSGSRGQTQLTTAQPPARAQETTMLLPVTAPRVTSAWVVPPVYSVGGVEGELLAMVLGDGKSSVLHRRLVKELQLASEASCFYYGATLGSLLRCDAVLAPGTTIESIKSAADAIFQEIGDRGPDAGDLERARSRWEAQTLHTLELGSTRANLINKYNQLAGRPDFVAMDFKMHLNASVESMRKVAHEYVALDHRVSIIVQPVKH